MNKEKIQSQVLKEMMEWESNLENTYGKDFYFKKAISRTIELMEEKVKSLKQDKLEYENYHKQLSKQIIDLKRFINNNFTLLSPKEAFERLRKKTFLIEKGLIIGGRIVKNIFSIFSFFFCV